eukprot:scaffold317704_cov21-Tisochrysis_lutea.AAC.1
MSEATVRATLLHLKLKRADSTAKGCIAVDWIVCLQSLPSLPMCSFSDKVQRCLLGWVEASAATAAEQQQACPLERRTLSKMQSQPACALLLTQGT